MDGDANIAALGAVLADEGRARILQALGDGRALPAGVLAREAGVSASTASVHLRRLVGAGLLAVEPQGRHRYFRLAGPQVGRLLETMAGLSPPAPVRSLREGTRAQAIREARTCYDHLAGRLGVTLMGAMLDRRWLAGGDGEHDPGRAREDRLSAPGRDVDYRLTDAGEEALTGLGVDLPALTTLRRPLVRYCVDWSEQRHHLAGALGAALAERLFELEWIERGAGRAVRVTPLGARRLGRAFGAGAGAASG